MLIQNDTFNKKNCLIYICYFDIYFKIYYDL